LIKTSQKDSTLPVESAIAENSSKNNRKKEINRPSTPVTAPETILTQLERKSRTPPTPSKKPNNIKKTVTAYSIEINKNTNFNKQLNFQEETTQNTEFSLNTFSSILNTFTNMTKPKKNNNNRSSTSNNNNNNQKNQKKSENQQEKTQEKPSFSFNFKEKEKEKNFLANTAPQMDKTAANDRYKNNKSDWIQDSFDDENNGYNTDESVEMVDTGNKDQNENDWNIILSNKRYSLTINYEHIPAKNNQEKKAWIYTNLYNQPGYIGQKPPSYKHQNAYKVEFKTEEHRNQAVQYLNETYEVQSQAFIPNQPKTATLIPNGIVIKDIPLGKTLSRRSFFLIIYCATKKEKKFFPAITARFT
jgi:hypothetical protein